jgi:dolichyl-phosphate beta-glucosyltransferase
MYGFHLYVMFVGGIHDIRDTQCGFKLFSRRAARLLFPNMRIERWA